MTNTEYRKFKAHIYMYLDPKELKHKLEIYKKMPKSFGVTWKAAILMCEYRLFDITNEQIMNTLREVYGNEFDESKYYTNDGNYYRLKNGEPYCYKTYKAKIARTIELMERRGEI